MIGLPKIEIKTKPKFGTEIIIDGRKMNGVRRFTLTQEVDGFPVLKFEVYAENIIVEGDSAIEIDGILTAMPSEE